MNVGRQVESGISFTGPLVYLPLDKVCPRTSIISYWLSLSALYLLLVITGTNRESVWGQNSVD